MFGCYTLIVCALMFKVINTHNNAGKYFRVSFAIMVLVFLLCKVFTVVMPQAGILKLVKLDSICS